MSRHVLLPLLGVLCAVTALAFSGNGLELMGKGRAYLELRGLPPEELEEARAMDVLDRLTKAAELFEEAMQQATSPREKEALEQYLRGTYQQVGAVHSDRKDYAAAAESYQKALDHAGDDTAALQTRIGEMLYQQGDYYGAAQALEKAREQTPAGDTRDRVSDELAAAYLKDAQTRDRESYLPAIRLIEERVSERPDDQKLLLQLAHIHELAGNLEKALEALEKARQLGPLAAGNEQGYQRLKAAAGAKKNFVRNEGRHFIIEFDDKTHGGLADKFLEFFEAAHDELGPRFGVQSDGAAKVSVNVYTKEQFGGAVKLSWAGALHQGNRIDLKINPKWSDQEYSETILHEYAHHLVGMKANGKPVPNWLHEGLAMHQEKKLDLSSYQKALARAWASGKLLPIDQLAAPLGELPVDDVFVAYAESYEFVDYLLEHHGLPAILSFLEKLGASTPVPAAFEAAMGTPFATAESKWRAVLDERLTKAGPTIRVGISPAGGTTAPASAGTRITTR